MSGQDSPVSWIRRCSSPGWRKASSLHERICVPTRSELVASILALSSFRFTPAIEATSLISSSSLKDEMVDGKKIWKYKKNTETRILLWYIFTTHFCRATRRICICPSFTLGKACEISTALQGSLRKLERPLSQFYWLLLEAVFKIFSLLFSSKITRKIQFALSLIVYSRPNITLSTRRFFTGIFAWTKLCISFVTRGYTLLIMAQKSHSRVYLRQHFESQGDEERLEAVFCSVRMLLRIGKELQWIWL